MSIVQLMANAGHGGYMFDAWTDTIGSNTFTTTGTVTDVTTDPEHKSFAAGARIDFTGGSTTAPMRVRFRFRRDSGQTGYRALFTRVTAVQTHGSLWTQGGVFRLYGSNGWNALYTPTNMYNTWFWIDLRYTGNAFYTNIYDGGTEDTPGTLLSNHYNNISTGAAALSTVRLMGGWSAPTYDGAGDLGAVYYRYNGTDTNWTSAFFPYKT